MKQFYYAIRTLVHGRGSNVTKILSLSLGLTIGILLFSQIHFELSYEECYPDADKLALVRMKMINVTTGEAMGDDGNSSYDETVMDPIAAALAEDLPQEIESASCVLPDMNLSVYKDDKLVEDVRYILVDSGFFQTFGIPVLKGNPNDIMMQQSVFISESFARKTFGGEDPIGKTLSLDKQVELTIRGVYKDVPENTMLAHDFVMSIYKDGGYFQGNGWKGNDIFYAFLRFRDVPDVDAMSTKIHRVLEKHAPTLMNDWKLEYNIVPLTERHADSPEVQKRLVIYGFLGFAIFFVAIMNYMLISIATLSRRAKVVGVHKCSGASTGNIFSMFLIETGLIVLVSVLISVFLIVNAQDLIEDLLSVRLASLFTVGTLWVPIATILILFLLAGFLPGRLFSRIPVTQVFRRHTDGKRGWKRSLLFVQFTGVAFVLGLLLVTLLQYSHLMNKDMGIKIPGLVEAESWIEPGTTSQIKDELRRQPMVEGVTIASHSVLGQYWTRGLMSNDGKRIGTLNMNYCDKGYTEVMGMQLVEGTPIRSNGDLLVNEELVRMMKWTDSPIGKKLNDFTEGNTIVGVFRDIRNESFYSVQSPIVLIGAETMNHTFNVRLKEPYDENVKRLNAFMEKTFPQTSLHFVTIDSKIKEGYKDVYRFRNSVWITSSFILLIVLMGLIGYVNDETQRRSKEIAIRKVNGAEASSILRLLSRDILYVSIPSVLMGTIVSYFAGQAWLDQFAETIELNPLLFVGAALAVMLIIIACVVLRAWKIANENPVLSIKSE